MRTLMQYMIAGCLFTGFGFQNCPGQKPLVKVDYVLNIIMWPIGMIWMIKNPYEACK